MKLAANISLLYQELPLLQRIAAAARDGFEGVEILFPYDLDPPALRAALQQCGMPLALINTPLGPSREPGCAAVAGAQAQFRDGLQRALDMASATGCPRIHVMAGRPLAYAVHASDTVADTAAGDRCATLIDNLQWAAPLARERSIALTLEALNHLDMPGYAYHRPAEALSVLQRLNEPNVGLQFDLFHAAREGLDLVAELETCRPWIHHVQIAEAPARTEPDLSRPAMVAALKRLIAWPYAGWLGMEYKPSGSTADSFGWMPALRALMGTR